LIQFWIIFPNGPGSVKGFDPFRGVEQRGMDQWHFDRVSYVTQTENIRIRLGPDLKPAWEGVLERHKITQQAAVAALIGWAVRQDPLTRAMIFGQVPDADHAELSRIVLRRLADGKVARKGK
jgi:hypothetical protein